MPTGQKPLIGVAAPNPGFAPEIEGAPASVAGGNDGTDKSKMTVAAGPSSGNKQDEPGASTDTEHETPAVSPEQQQRVDATAGIDRKIAAYRAYIDSLPEPETPEKRAKREKLEKSKRIIGAVSDGLRAMSNLWFTSQYAPNMYNHEKDSQLNETNRWIDKAKAEREKLREEHLRYAIGLGDAENERAKTLRELEAEQERQKLAREAAQRDAEKHGWLALLQPDKQREQKGKADRAEQEAITAQAVAEAAPELQQAKIATEKARKGSLADTSGAKKHHFRGRVYLSDKDYAKDVAEAARDYNERHMEEVEVDDGRGGKKKERRYKAGFRPIVTEDYEEKAYGRERRARNPEEYAGEVESRLAEEEEDNTPPTRRNNDNRPPTRR